MHNPLQVLVNLTPTEEKLWDSVNQQEVMSRISFIKPRKKGKKSRQVQQKIKVLRCTFPRKEKDGIEVTLVQAKEMNPPTGRSPLVWRLLSNRLVENEAQASELVGIAAAGKSTGKGNSEKDTNT